MHPAFLFNLMLKRCFHVTKYKYTLAYYSIKLIYNTAFDRSTERAERHAGWSSEVNEFFMNLDEANCAEWPSWLGLPAASPTWRFLDKRAPRGESSKRSRRREPSLALQGTREGRYCLTALGVELCSCPGKGAGHWVSVLGYGLLREM